MHSGKSKVIASIIATSVVLPAAYGISYADENNTQARNTEYRIITGNSVNVRKGPGTNYSSIMKLNKGDKVEYISTSGNWINIKYNSKIGYVYSDYVGKISTESSDNSIKSTKIVTGNSVNVRTGPSTSYSSITQLSKGVEVGYISESNGWSKISYNGKVGYMSSQYLKEKSSTPSTESSDNSVKSTKVVTGNSVNVRTGPSTSYSSITQLSKGVEVGYISESNGWSKISYNGKVGYMSSQYLKEKSSTPSTESSDNSVKSTKVVTGNSVNVRTGPSTSYSSITQLSKGVEVGYISESNGWSKISYNGKVGYMSSQYLKEKSSTPSTETTNNKSDKIVSVAKSLLGKPYVWGAEGPSSFDCSGYVQYVFKQAVGVNLPRVSKEQSKYGQYVSKSNLQVGDIVCFDTDGNNNGDVGHSGIYIGNGEFIHASSAKGKVIISNLSSGFYSDAFVNGRRVI